jgi:hypothetical protein
MERLSPADRQELARLDGPARAGDPAAARLAHLVWRTDFSDADEAPDFAMQPLFAYPRNADAGRALRQSADKACGPA